MGLSHGATIPLYGIDPEHDSTVQPWLDEQRGIDFQDGQVILGHRVRGRLGDRLCLQEQTFQIYGHLAASGVPSHEHGLFFTLSDLNNLIPSGDPDTLGINGLLVQAPPEFTIERLRFSLLAQTSRCHGDGSGGPCWRWCARGTVESSAGECVQHPFAEQRFAVDQPLQLWHRR